jgi:hypothetical protein
MYVHGFMFIRPLHRCEPCSVMIRQRFSGHWCGVPEIGRSLPDHETVPGHFRMSARSNVDVIVSVCVCVVVCVLNRGDRKRPSKANQLTREAQRAETKTHTFILPCQTDRSHAQTPVQHLAGENQHNGKES